MKFSPKAFTTIVIVLSGAVTAVLGAGLVPPQYVPFVAGLSTLLGSLAQKKDAKE